MTFQIDDVLDFLALSENPCSIREISEALNIPHSVCKIIFEFLSKHGFIKFEGEEVTINLKMKEFIMATSNRNSALRFTPSVPVIPTRKDIKLSQSHIF